MGNVRVRKRRGGEEITEDEQKVRGGREKIYRREKNTGSKEGQGT